MAFSPEKIAVYASNAHKYSSNAHASGMHIGHVYVLTNSRPQYSPVVRCGFRKSMSRRNTHVSLPPPRCKSSPCRPSRNQHPPPSTLNLARRTYLTYRIHIPTFKPFATISRSLDQFSFHKLIWPSSAPIPLNPLNPMPSSRAPHLPKSSPISSHCDFNL